MICGWDVSTSIVGLVILDVNQLDGDPLVFLESHHLDLRKLETFQEKCDAAERWVRSIDLLQDEDAEHYIEERLGNFAGGRSMLQVLMKLAAFNAVVSHLIHQVTPHSKITHIHPSTWKAVMKKDGLLIPKGSDEKKALTLQFARDREPRLTVDVNKNGKPQPWMYDIADAYCIGRAGYLKYAQGTKAECLETVSGG